jgi:hypothetical protein
MTEELSDKLRGFFRYHTSQCGASGNASCDDDIENDQLGWVGGGSAFLIGTGFPYLDMNGQAEQCSSSPSISRTLIVFTRAFVPWLHITKDLWVGFPYHRASLVIPSALSCYLYP